MSMMRAKSNGKQLVQIELIKYYNQGWLYNESAIRVKEYPEISSHNPKRPFWYFITSEEVKDCYTLLEDYRILHDILIDRANHPVSKRTYELVVEAYARFCSTQADGNRPLRVMNKASNSKRTKFFQMYSRPTSVVDK